MDGIRRFATDSFHLGRAQGDRLKHRIDRLFYSYPSTVLLVWISTLTFILIQVNYLVQLLSWIFYYLDIIARFLFSWVYPAAVFSLGAVFFLRLLPKTVTQKLDMYLEQSRTLVICLAVFSCVVAGQLTLVCLPPIVNFLAVPFATDPTSLLTFIVILAALVYGGYYSIFADTPEARYYAQRNDMDDRGDENTCAVCLVNPKTILIKPCRHFCVCADCSRQLVECPVCKTNILDYERIFPT